MKVDLQKWIEENIASDDMIWKKSSSEQIKFVQKTLSSLVTVGANNVSVISTHTSKSIKLPVYLLEREGIKIILRDNFYNWKMSVISDTPIELNFDGLFHTTPPVDPDYTGNPLASVYFEGFPKDLIFGYYAESDKKKWSAEIDTNRLLWTTLFLIMRFIGLVQPFAWAVRQKFTLAVEKKDD